MCAGGVGSLGATEIVNAQSYFASYIVFAPNEIDPERLQEFLKSARNDDGTPRFSERRLERLEDEFRDNLQAQGIDPDQVDWRTRAIMAWGEDRNALPIAEPPHPPADWMQLGFDEAGWVTRPAPLLIAPGSMHGITDRHLPVPRRVRAAFFRTVFVVEKPGEHVLNLSYAGGVRVFLNGSEIARDHLPAGEIGPNTWAEGYDSHQPEGRQLKPIVLPQALLRRGNNVLAIEVRSPRIHPSAIDGADSRTRGNLWDLVIRPHCRINAISLRSSAPDAVATFRREKRDAVWPIDANARLYDTDFAPRGAEGRALRIVGTRNGTFSGMVGVTSATDVRSLRIAATPLVAAGRDGQRDPARMPELRITAMAGHDFETFNGTGGHRGVKQWAPYQHFKERLRYDKPPVANAVIDEIRTEPDIESLAAGALGAFWVSVAIPAATPPGIYHGTLRVMGEGMSEQRLPIEVHVCAWTLPDPAAWRTDVWLEVSPYALAERAGVPLWSEAHLGLVRQAFAQVGRAGTNVVMIPVLQQSEFGNGDDSLVRWQGGDAIIDVSTLGPYLDAALAGLGKPEAIIFGVMQGHMGGTSIQTADRRGSIALDDAQWRQFAQALHTYMRSRNLEGSMVWGLPWDLLPGPKQAHIRLLREAAPEVRWARASHAYGFDEDFRYVSVVYFGMDGRYSGLKRKAGAKETDMGEGFGWQKDGMFVSNPRLHNTVQEIFGYTPPFAFRIFPNRALGLGYTGIGRMGANYWGTWAGQSLSAPSRIENGQSIANAELVDFTIKDLLWFDAAGGRIHSSQRFEMLREGLQEAEARIALEQALVAGKLNAALQGRVREVLERHQNEVNYITRRTNSHLTNDHSQRWQQRIQELFDLAAEVGAQ